MVNRKERLSLERGTRGQFHGVMPICSRLLCLLALFKRPATIGRVLWENECDYISRATVSRFKPRATIMRASSGKGH